MQTQTTKCRKVVARSVLVSPDASFEFDSNGVFWTPNPVYPSCDVPSTKEVRAVWG